MRNSSLVSPSSFRFELFPSHNHVSQLVVVLFGKLVNYNSFHIENNLKECLCFAAFHSNLSTQLLHSRGDLVVAYWLSWTPHRKRLQIKCSVWCSFWPFWSLLKEQFHDTLFWNVDVCYNHNLILLHVSVYQPSSMVLLHIPSVKKVLLSIFILLCVNLTWVES